MLENLLGYWGGKPTAGLAHAGEELKKAATTATAATAEEVEGYRNDRHAIHVAIEEGIYSNHGRHKGPVQTAVGYLGDCINAALKEHYRLSNDKVKSSLGYFALALATAGFDGEDTTGTQMGQFLGEWRGGGF